MCISRMYHTLTVTHAVLSARYSRLQQVRPV